MPRTILRFAGGRELTLGDLGARQGVLGGINAVIVGNYLTTLGRDPQDDLDLLAELSMPVKELSKTTLRHWSASARRNGLATKPDHRRRRIRECAQVVGGLDQLIEQQPIETLIPKRRHPCHAAARIDGGNLQCGHTGDS